MMQMSQLDLLVQALGATANPTPLPVPVSGAVFVGSGDSLASSLLAEGWGHRARSSGDVTWTGNPPPGATTLVGVSHSGTSGATVRALEVARDAGLRTVAVTSAPDSLLARAADDVIAVANLAVTEEVPCSGHLMLSLGVAAACGLDLSGAAAELAKAVGASAALVEATVAVLPTAAPGSISVLSLPDRRSAGDFAVLKLIEATGIAARSVALEESGHVDYFIGPEPHLAIHLVGEAGRARHARLAEALRSTGQTVQEIVMPTVGSAPDHRSRVQSELIAAVVGTLVAAAAAIRWDRPPFRGGAVNMDASHIKVGDGLWAAN